MSTVSFIGRVTAIAANASAFSFESLETCFNCQASKFSSHQVTDLHIWSCAHLLFHILHLPTLPPIESRFL